MMSRQLAGRQCRCAAGPSTRPQQRSHTPAAALTNNRQHAQSAQRQQRQRQQRQIACAAVAAEYSSAPTSNFASLDALELERLHTQLRSACSWLDISASVADFGSMMVDEASVVAALVRLAAIYSHLGESNRSDVRTSGLVERLAAMTERRLPALTPQQLADALDALARLEFHAPASFLRAADRQAQESLPDFAPSQLPLLLCALVALGQEPGAALVDALGEALAHQDLAVAPSDVARMLCALAALAGSPPPQALLKGLGSALRRQLDSFRPAELSQALGAMAKLKFHPGSDVLRRIAARAGMRKPAHAARSSGPRSAVG